MEDTRLSASLVCWCNILSSLQNCPANSWISVLFEEKIVSELLPQLSQLLISAIAATASQLEFVKSGDSTQEALGFLTSLYFVRNNFTHTLNKFLNKKKKNVQS